MEKQVTSKLKKFSCPTCNFELAVVGTAEVWCKKGHTMRTNVQWAEFEKNRLAREAKKKLKK